MELKDTAEALAVLAGPAYLAKTTGVTQERKDALKGTWTEGYTGTYMTIAARELRAASPRGSPLRPRAEEVRDAMGTRY